MTAPAKPKRIALDLIDAATGAVEWTTPVVAHADEPRCSFCGRAKRDAATLIDSPTGATICDACVRVGVAMLRGVGAKR